MKPGYQGIQNDCASREINGHVAQVVEIMIKYVIV